MKSAIYNITVMSYNPDNSPAAPKIITNPAWEEVEAAIRKLDNYGFPIVQLNVTEDEEDENNLHIIGGDGRFALFQPFGDWQYEDPDGGEDEVVLWESDQGYVCQAKNVLTDIEKVLRITKVFYVTGSFEELDSVE